MSKALTPKNVIKCLRFCIGFDIFLALAWFVFCAGVYLFKYDIFYIWILNRLFYFWNMDGAGNGPVFENDFYGYTVSFLCVSAGFAVTSVWFLNDMKDWGRQIKKLAKEFVRISFGLCVVIIGSYLLLVNL